MVGSDTLSRLVPEDPVQALVDLFDEMHAFFSAIVDSVGVGVVVDERLVATFPLAPGFQPGGAVTSSAPDFILVGQWVVGVGRCNSWLRLLIQC